jgi:hypothetical protein
MTDKNDEDSEWWIVEEIQDYYSKHFNVPSNSLLVHDNLYYLIDRRRCSGLTFTDGKVIGLDIHTWGINELFEIFAELKSLEYLNLTWNYIPLDKQIKHRIISRFSRHFVATIPHYVFLICGNVVWGSSRNLSVTSSHCRNSI